jgi:hypothetical protein
MPLIRNTLNTWLKKGFGFQVRPGQRRRRPSLAVEQLQRRDVPAVIAHGGSVLENVEVQALYLGSGWSSNTQVATASLDTYLTHLVNSSYMDMLSAAGYGVGRGRFTGSVVDPVNLSGVVNDADIQSTLELLINNGTLPVPNANTLYFVYIAPGHQIDVTRKDGWAGYHTTFTGQSGSVAGIAIPYAVLPYPGGVNTINSDLPVFDNLTEVSSHEMAESVTDPFLDAWYDDQGEIGDLVAWQYVSWDGYTVQKEANQNGNALDPNDFKTDPDAPTPLGPVNGIDTEYPTFSWSAATGADHYDLWVSDLTTGQSPVMRNRHVNGTSFTFSEPLTPGHSYRYWVEAVNNAGTTSYWSSPRTITVAPVGVPVVSAPAGTITDTNPTFGWSAVAGADHYDLWISDLTTGQEQALRNKNVTGTSTTFSQPLVPGHDYRIWVRTIDGAGFTSDWSSPVDIVEAPLVPPTPLTPSSTINNKNPTFSWNAVAGADHYDVWVSDATLGQGPALRNQAIAGTSFTFSQALTPSHSYRFWVRALDSAGFASDWSNSLDFKEAPVAQPMLFAPLGPVGSKTPTFSWTAAAGADHYDVWVSDMTVGQGPVLRNQTVLGTSFAFAQSLTAGHNYRFWVRTIDTDGFASDWSSPLDFLVAALPAPTLNAPVGASNTLMPQFSWYAVTGAADYEIWVDDLTTGTSQVIWQQNILSNSWTTPLALNAGDTYRWWVRAFNNASEAGLWSNSQDFVAI